MLRKTSRSQTLWCGEIIRCHLHAALSSRSQFDTRHERRDQNCRNPTSHMLKCLIACLTQIGIIKKMEVFPKLSEMCHTSADFADMRSSEFDQSGLLPCRVEIGPANEYYLVGLLDRNPGEVLGLGEFTPTPQQVFRRFWLEDRVNYSALRVFSGKI